MNAPVLVNGCAEGSVSPLDRGLLYGDGLFETIRFHHGVAPLWRRHMQRLRDGCECLGLEPPDPGRLADESVHVLDGRSEGVVRITLTRGVGERGYAPPACPAATRIVSAHPLPALDPDWYRHGIRVRSCGLRLAVQPRLAGVKHLNRLEQVLARAEWTDPGIVEGLLFDRDGQLVSATAANVFGVLEGVPVTPTIDTCGVAGVMRAELLEVFPQCSVGRVPQEQMARLEEMFVTSAVRGIVPVCEIDGHDVPVGPFARAAQGHWRAIGFGGSGA